MKILRTPDERFEALPDYSFEPHYADIGDGLRVHYVDEGPRGSAPVLLMHGEPSWSFLYRKMIPVLVSAGHRCVAPDLVGFGRSDKPSEQSDYSYQRHVDWMRSVPRHVSTSAPGANVTIPLRNLVGKGNVGSSPSMSPITASSMPQWNVWLSVHRGFAFAMSILGGSLRCAALRSSAGK